MKKLLKLMAMLFGCIAISAGLAACSSDDDEPADGSVEQLLIGVWVDNYGDGYIFNKGGKGTGFEVFEDEEPDYWAITYTVKGKRVTITEFDGDQYYFDITAINDKVMHVVEDDGYTSVYKRTTEADLGL